MKRKLATVALTALTSIGVLLAIAAPAQAVTWYQTTGSAAWCFSNHSCWVEYTGSWPSGQVRAAADQNLTGIKLQVSTNNGSSWSTAAIVYHGQSGWPKTPIVTAGKFSTYRPCTQTIPNGAWWCGGSIYLGD